MRRTLPVIILLIGSVAECLELYRVDVPHYKRVGEMAELQCQFQLGRDRLYAVKWYKDNEEFFRYVPRFNPSIHTHSVPGVHVDVMRSTAEVVILKSVSVRSTGLYKCEVSAEAPSFASFMGEGRMTVVYLPKEGPQITGNLRDEYEVGDMLDLNCTSSKSFPPARISWYINDIPVMGHSDTLLYDDNNSIELFPTIIGNGKYSGGSSTTTTHSSLNNGHNLIRSTSRRLLLELTPAHFGKGTAKIRCVARIFPLFWQDGDEKNIDYKQSSSGHKNPLHNVNSNFQQQFNDREDEDEDDEKDKDRPRHHSKSHDHEPVGSLYKGEALIQIRGGSNPLSNPMGTLILFPIILLLASNPALM